MNGGSARLKAQGFTIIETLIVLAVSMALFLSASALINGKQYQTAFNQGSRAIQGQVDRVINDVGAGYYTNDGTISCNRSSSGTVALRADGVDSQGTNKDCIYLGKVLQFGIAGSDMTDYNEYTIVGLRGGNTGTNSLNLAASRARVIARASGEEATTIPDAFETVSLQYGMDVASMYYTSPANPIAAVGFATNLTSLGAGDGSQRIDVVAIRNTTLGVSAAQGAGQINTNLGAAVVNPPGGVFICFAAGGINRSALLNVGGSGSQNTSTIKLFNTRTCT